ncbi:hypothetical protein D3C80_1657250 [compost metagenome]
MYGERHAIDLAVPGLAVEQGQAGEECHAGTASGQQLFAGFFERVGLADNPLSQHGDLVGADYQMSGMAVGQGARFLFGEALDQLDGGLARAMAFVDIRRAASERQLQAGQQFPAIGRAGSE